MIAAASAVDSAKRAIEHIRIGEDIGGAFSRPGAPGAVFWACATLVSVVLGVLAVLILLEVWGIDAFAWFSSDQLGGRALGAVIVIGVTLAAAMLVWEAVNGAVERQLARLVRARGM